MMIFRKFVDALSAWFSSVLTGFDIISHRFSSPKRVRFVENEAGILVIESSIQGKHAPELSAITLSPERNLPLPAAAAGYLLGCHAEIVLRTQRFLFRPIELPHQATEFLGGIVQAQIDRLTPWTAAQAVYGWTGPANHASGRVTVDIAAAAKAVVTPYIEAVQALRVGFIKVVALHPKDQIPVVVWRGQTPSFGLNVLVPRILAGVMMVAAGFSGFCWVLAAVQNGYTDRQRQEVERQIVQARRIAEEHMNRGLDESAAASVELVDRKQKLPFVVLTLDSLSRLVPKHSYVTEFRIEGNKIRLSGITKDAPSLIGILEQSGAFAQASFFAPTTRSEGGERFHIEATIQPLVRS